MTRVLAVDDQPDFLALLVQMLSARGYETTATESAEDAIAAIGEGEFDVVLCDMIMPPTGGMRVIEEAQKLEPRLPVVLMTGYGSIESALEALKLGVFDYVTKPFEMDELDVTINRALAWSKGGERATATPISFSYDVGGLVASSPAMQEVCLKIRQLVPVVAPVLIQGEKGVGKRRVASTLHEMGGRQPEQFLVVNCAELERGGADGDGATEAESLGLLEQLRGYTLCLVDVEMLPPDFQQELLQILGGGSAAQAEGSQPADVRIVATTSADLARYVEQGLFLAALAERLQRVTMSIAPLRERVADIMPLMAHFMAKRLGDDAAAPTFEPDVCGVLNHYDWPGNVAELKGLAGMLLVKKDDRTVTRQQLPESILQQVVSSGYHKPDDDESERGVLLREFLKTEEGRLKKRISG